MSKKNQIEEYEEFDEEEDEAPEAPESEDEETPAERMRDLVRSDSDLVLNYGDTYWQFTTKQDTLGALSLARTILQNEINTEEAMLQNIAVHKAMMLETDPQTYLKMVGAEEFLREKKERLTRVYGVLNKRMLRVADVKLH